MADIVRRKFLGNFESISDYNEDTRLRSSGGQDYDPEIGRWLSKDPIRFAAGDTNLYG